MTHKKENNIKPFNEEKNVKIIRNQMIIIDYICQLIQQPLQRT